MSLLTIPSSTTELNFTLAIISELICFLTILIMTIWGFIIYKRDPKPLKKLVLIVACTYVLVLILMVTPKLAVFFDLINPLIFSDLMSDFERLAAFVVMINMGVFWEFECQIFSEDKNRNKARIIYLIPLGLLFIILLFNVTEYSNFASGLLLLSLILYGRLVYQSRKLIKRVNSRFEKVRIGFLYWAGIIMIVSYIMSIIQGILQRTVPGAGFSLLHSFAAIFGSLALFIFFLSFFQPAFLISRMIKDEDLPPLDLKLNPAEFEDDLPKLTQDEMKKGTHFTEWWYFDFEDFETKAKVVGILKRADTTLFPKFGGIHVEWTDPDGVNMKLYKKVPFDTFKHTLIDEKMHVELYPNNYFEETKGNSMAFDKITLNIEIGKIKINLNAQAVAPGIKFGPQGRYYVSKTNPRNYSAATLSVPLFSGKAVVQVGDKTFNMNCSGYHDHVYSTSDFLETHNKWYWARGYSGDVYMMYAEVFPQRLYYGLMKYLYIIPKIGTQPKYDNSFKIIPEEFKKDKGLAFPRKISVVSNALEANLSLNFKENHVDQAVYNRSIFDVKFDGKLFEKPINSTAFVEFYNIPPLIAGLSRKLVKKQYKKWLVD